MTDTTQTAYLAGGCFWGMEELVRQISGVVETEVGYTGGETPNATYDIVKTGHSGHAESLKIVFDPNKVTYRHLLFEFFRMHDPTTPNRQGNDFGTQYRSAIFYLNEEQKRTAEEVIRTADASGDWKAKVVTEVVPFKDFWRAEEYHQKYLVKNPGGYTCHYVRRMQLGE
jgi:peptide-methionine (S)-S-oxide reductase/peptide methionine sulfoxide reductase msrA/msrB